MVVPTLIIGFLPLADTAGKKPREIRDYAYMKELLAGFDLGEVHFASSDNWKQVINEINPLFTIVFGEYYAEQVKEYKKDSLIYVTYDSGQIFYRKAEIEKKKAEQRKTLEEIARLAKDAKEGDEKHISDMRKFAGMSYNDMYKMLIQAIIGDKEDLRKKAWSLLTDNNVHKNFIWMRVQLLCEVWDHCDGKGKEEFLCMAMQQHIDNELARKLGDFTDAEDQVFHQYMFVDFFGCDLNYIRRIPVGEKKQDKYVYTAILEKYETPNGVQMMLEAGQMETKKKEYFQCESEKVANVLRAWKEDPAKSMKELHVASREEGTEDEPLSKGEMESLKNFLREHDNSVLEEMFK